MAYESIGAHARGRPGTGGGGGGGQKWAQLTHLLTLPPSLQHRIGLPGGLLLGSNECLFQKMAVFVVLLVSLSANPKKATLKKRHTQTSTNMCQEVFRVSGPFDFL